VIPIPDLIFYHAPQSRSSIVHWMLEEIGEPYDLHLLDLNKEENRQPAYLAVNPMGKVPAISHEGVVVTEAAAICCYLADRFPAAGLSVPVDQARRGLYLKWLFFGPSCLEPAMIDRMMKREGGPRRALGWGDLEAVIGVLRQAVSQAPFLMGERFTAADVVIGSGLRYGMMVNGLPELPEFIAYTKRLETRPALKRATAKDAELAKRAGG
jgi:glutathione S-transferase